MIDFRLSDDDAQFLRDQLARHSKTIENELVHTEKREMQHDLATELTRMNDIRARLDTALTRG